jgi:hypothetical protein
MKPSLVFIKYTILFYDHSMNHLRSDGPLFGVYIDDIDRTPLIVDTRSILLLAEGLESKLAGLDLNPNIIIGKTAH